MLCLHVIVPDKPRSTPLPPLSPPYPRFSPPPTSVPKTATHVVVLLAPPHLHSPMAGQLLYVHLAPDTKLTLRQYSRPRVLPSSCNSLGHQGSAREQCGRGVLPDCQSHAAGAALCASPIPLRRSGIASFPSPKTPSLLWRYSPFRPLLLLLDENPGLSALAMACNSHITVLLVAEHAGN